MMLKTPYFAPISNILGSINHVISGIFFEQRALPGKNPMETSAYSNFNTTDFSKPDQSELFAHQEAIDPLLEAEVYAIYGRLNDAENVLDAALKAGQITAGDISLFWSLRDAESSRHGQH